MFATRRNCSNRPYERRLVARRIGPDVIRERGRDAGRGKPGRGWSLERCVEGHGRGEGTFGRNDHQVYFEERTELSVPTVSASSTEEARLSIPIPVCALA